MLVSIPGPTRYTLWHSAPEISTVITVYLIRVIEQPVCVYYFPSVSVITILYDIAGDVIIFFFFEKIYIKKGLFYKFFFFYLTWNMNP